MEHAVKAVGDWELDVLGNPYGKDSDKQWFDENTEIVSGREIPVIYFHGVSDDKRRFVDKPVVIGKATDPQRKADGVWWRVVLDKTKAEALKVWEGAKSGVAVASSGAIDYLSRLERGGKMIPYNKTIPGRIAVWHMGELSLWDNAGNRPQAHPYAVALPALKSVYEQAGIEMPDVEEPKPEAEGDLAAESEAIKTKRKALKHRAMNILLEE